MVVLTTLHDVKTEVRKVVINYLSDFPDLWVLFEPAGSFPSSVMIFGKGVKVRFVENSLYIAFLGESISNKPFVHLTASEIDGDVYLNVEVLNWDMLFSNCPILSLLCRLDEAVFHGGIAKRLNSAIASKQISEGSVRLD